jgi:hypothetical protein
MKNKYMILTLIVLLALCGSCSNTAMSAADMEKTLVPDASWTCGMPNGIPKPESGTLVFEAQMNLDKVYEVGKTQYGQRKVFVIKDGTVKGEKIQASVLPGGLDFHLTLSNGVIEIEQVLVFRINEGGYIYMRNAGTGINEKDVRVVMDFEAPNNSTAAWLNTGQYAARRTVDSAAGTMKLAVYEVSAVAPDAGNTVKISKPTDVPSQPWEYRTASAAEQRGEQFIVETVALGASTSIGASKRGMRNIIPITGGTLSGQITGKVLFGGADYQNFTNGPAIDARYLWQPDDGGIIIVRNTGPMGTLVPIFETRVDSKYSWLNSGKYLSSPPGMGAGGISITMYKSN